MKKTFFLIIPIVLVLLAGCSLQQLKPTGQNESAQITEQKQKAQIAPAESKAADDPYEKMQAEYKRPLPGDITSWKTYTNNQYGFELKYPVMYNTFVNTYGWPKSIIHFIENVPGTQAARAVISVWDSENDYKDIPVYLAMKHFCKYKVGAKYILISYSVSEEEADIISEWEKICDTFKSTIK
ncbi:MAG: hypothetical protein UT02_C0059G0007 [Parcubacteria group bacterium GW2011_GWC2_38_7]|nr:MAG: hypothetical protein UT02_C0059G0007 [Parcubacteria group bacterium GW2011_GWC2_38_7]